MTNHQKVTFDENVLSYVKNSRKVDDSILNDRLVKPYDHFGSLLHYAASARNEAVVRQLIDLGSEVDLIDRNGRTPLMIAVEARCSAALAEIFLKAKASIDIVDGVRRSVLQMALGNYQYDSPLVNLFVNEVRTKRTTTEALAKRLIAAGCTMFEAATLRDVKVMQCMLDHGIGINSTVSGCTALHRAAEMGDVGMAKWLVQKGADVNAINFFGISALNVAAKTKNRKRAMIKILLERGADPNFKHIDSGFNSLETIFAEQTEGYLNVEEAVKCVELLLQHGATFDLTPLEIYTVFDYALMLWLSDKTVKILTSQLAVFKMVGSYVSEPVKFCCIAPRQQAKLENFYQLCLRVLETKLFEDLSLLNLLNASESRLNSLVRRKTFASYVERACSKQKLDETHAFYYKTLMKRIDKACRVVKLEDKAIFSICRLFRCCYNQCHNFAREIVSYLKEYELKKLVQV